MVRTEVRSGWEGSGAATREISTAKRARQLGLTRLGNTHFQVSLLHLHQPPKRPWPNISFRAADTEIPDRIQFIPAGYSPSRPDAVISEAFWAQVWIAEGVPQELIGPAAAERRDLFSPQNPAAS